MLNSILDVPLVNMGRPGYQLDNLEVYVDHWFYKNCVQWSMKLQVFSVW
jgi:hypothetical protein